ncbi:secretory phospholipase A2 receptor-like [Notolabrus celidotus]|uniref:secretory phospholipase A2 receptor-like n=1 Tax=Notolabrus celidotus TaxID=1203425 RepID=UPI00148FAF87|nr:secretory phospholipase A2 receptor-like [Notolabrus celidotus]
MMERIFLAVLCLSGWNVSSCLPRQYHYVADPMTWTEAQAYCRETYTDLATIESPEEMKQVNQTVLLSGLDSEVWIGLYNNILWKWSDNYTGSGAEYRKWSSGLPDNLEANELCVTAHTFGWFDTRCIWRHTFVCYRGTQQDPEFVYINETMSWSSAQRFCRENYIDLATVKNDTEYQKVLNMTPSGAYHWIGLHRDLEVYWSDGSNSSFTYWERVFNPLGSMTVVCGVSDLERSGKWRLLPCESKFPFVCYSVPQPVKRHVMKLRMKPEDPSVNLNDPAVKADILRKLQDKLKESQLSGVTLTWREQPDGKVTNQALLLFTGWDISSCLPRQYHHVADPMTWTEAQAYCRETYTDLATIESPEEMDQVNSTVLLSDLNSEFWIGLYSNIIWEWSGNYTGSGAEYRKWASGHPELWVANEFCVSFKAGAWYDARCSFSLTFVCYRGTQQDPEFVYINETMSWSSAQRYCRENYIDLATVKNDTENQKIQSLTPSGAWHWIGLYRDPHVYWSDGSSSSFRYWEDVFSPLGSMTVVCGVSDLERSGKWRLLPCESKFPFVCYSVPQPVKRHVIKLRMKPEDPSVDLNDPAVKADILRELQDRLKKSGLSGVTLKWREQPDGKVFHKEGERSHGREDSTLKLKSDCPFVVQ